MKSIRYILLSYFQQHFFGTLGFVLAIFMFFIANIYLFSQNGSTPGAVEKSFNIFLYALLVMVYISGVHLNRVIRSNATALLPNYRRDQLIALLILLSIFIVWPVVLLSLFDFPPLYPLALLLSSSLFILWLSFKYGEGIFILLLIIWATRFFYETLNFQTSVSYFFKITRLLNTFFGFMYPVSLIVLSLLGFIWFFRHVKRISITKLLNQQYDNTDPWARDFDRAGPVTEKLMMRVINKSLHSTPESLKTRIQKFQIYLFGPAMITNTQFINLLFMTAYFYTISLIFTAGFAEISENFVVVCYLFLFVIMSLLSADFLQHRERLPVLYLQSGIKTRKQFLRTVVYSYLIVASKQFIFLTVLFLTVPLFLPVLSLEKLWPMYVLGFFAFVLQLSFSLILSKEIVSPEAKGWTLTNVILAIISTPVVLAMRPLLTMPFFITGALLCLTVFLLSLNQWQKTELDFSGPELPG